MALLNSKSPERPVWVKQLSCRFARTSGRWVASPLSRINKAARTRGFSHYRRISPVSLSKAMAEPVLLLPLCNVCHGRVGRVPDAKSR
jgi:hypothetical protein